MYRSKIKDDAMTPRRARAILRRYIRRGFITREPFTFSGKFVTLKKTTVDLFAEALECLGGWTTGIDDRWVDARGRRLYKVHFCLPDLPELVGYDGQ